jgi:hypothetical protein
MAMRLWPALFCATFVACSADPEELPPASGCLALFQPTRLDVGTIGRGHTTSQFVVLLNRGTAVCTLTALDVDEGDAGLRILPADLPIAISAGASLTFTVELLPVKAGPFDDAIIATMEDGFTLSTLIFGIADEAQLAVEPSALELRAVTGCSASGRFVVRNIGTIPVTFQPMITGESFSLDITRELQVPPRTSQAIDVLFSPHEAKLHQATVWAGGPEVPVSGIGAPADRVTKTVQIEPKPKFDVLWILDHTLLMVEELVALEAGMTDLRYILQRSDSRFAFTSTDMGGAAGRFLPLEGAQILTSTATWQEWQALLPWLDDNADPRGLLAMETALSETLLSTHNAGFPREDSHLYIMFISIGDDRSPGSVADYFPILADRSIPARVGAITGGQGGCTDGEIFASPAPRYDEAASIHGPACSPFSVELQDAFLPAVPRPDIAFDDPPVEGSIEVMVDGQILPATDANGRRNWTYFAQRRVLSLSNLAPVEWGSRIEASYTPGCEN